MMSWFRITIATKILGAMRLVQFSTLEWERSLEQLWSAWVVLLWRPLLLVILREKLGSGLASRCGTH
ncbi:hypothetical protein CCZ27_15220 [Thauera sinica]|nr:hypothetical protein CCZ27_15220 [Thauera sp. K11]